jgi:hypothetical protein
MATQSFPGTSFTPKSFWKKPEGVPGMVLTALGIAAGVWGLYLALPFLLSVVWGTVNLAIGIAILAAIGYVVTNGTIQTLAKNVFQSFCRGLATFYTTIDPIGILKNQLDDMKKAKGQLDQTIQRFAGSDKNLRDSIDRKKSEIQTLGAKSNEARRQAAAIGGSDQTAALKREQITLQAQTYEEKGGLLMQAVNQLQGLETQTADMLIKFRHWSQVSDAKIDRTAMRVEIFSDQRKMILDAKSTLSIGQRLLKGDSEQLKLVDGAIEFLQEDAARTLGEIEEFNRFSDKMLTDIDIENGANAALARQKFAEFGVKLDADAARPTAADQLQGAVAAAIASPGFNPNAMGRTTSAGTTRTPNANANSGDYGDMFK